MDNLIKKDEDNEETYSKYKCEECGINFGYSLGDMELHKLSTFTKRRYRNKISNNSRFTLWNILRIHCFWFC
jgi:hypothetical protein